jgi:hypothetical protein
LWKVYELIYIIYTGPSGFINLTMGLAIDLWIDTLDALTICFIYDEFTHQTEKDKDLLLTKKSILTYRF